MAKTSNLIRHFSAGKNAAEFGMKESKDCVVRALSNCAEIPYIEAHDALKRAGRSDFNGTPVHIFTRVYKEYGIYPKAAFGTTNGALFYKQMCNIPQLKGITLGNLLKSKVLDDGKFVVCLSSHVFAVIDGEIIDTGYNKSGKSVVAIYQKSE